MKTSQNIKTLSWKTAIPVMILVCTWILFWYRETFESMVHLWANSDTYAHGYIVLPITLWLVWNERQHFVRYRPLPNYLYILALLPVLFIWSLGQLASVNAATQLAATLAIIISVMSIIGTRLSIELAFPLAFLLFAVPIGDFMMPKLMQWTADFTVLALRGTGIPVYREGLQFVIPSGTWSVVEACSGIRYLIASLMVGTLFAYLNYNSTKRRMIFMLLALVVPIIANWLRAYLIVMLGHLSGNKLAAGVDHLIYGWVFFGIVIGAMFALGMRWSEPRPEALADLTPIVCKEETNTRFWSLLALLLITTAAPPLIIGQLTRHEESGQASLTLNIPQPHHPAEGWKPAWSNASAELHQTYGDGNEQVGVFIAYYQDQNTKRKLITSTNMLVQYQDNNWLVTAQGSTELSVNKKILRLRTAEIVQKAASQPSRLNVYYWYWIDGHLTTSDIMGKLYTTFNQLIGRGDHSAIVILYTNSDTESSKRISQFIAVNAENIEKMLEQAGRVQ